VALVHIDDEVIGRLNGHCGRIGRIDRVGLELTDEARQRSEPLSRAVYERDALESRSASEVLGVLLVA
jgi:hypothetical protein